MRATGFLMFALAFFAAPLAHAQRSPSTSMVCAPTSSEHVLLATIAADPAKWLGHCVTVAGIYNDERVYADIDAIYGRTGASIGGYVDGRGSMDGFWRGEFTGRIGDCAKAAADLEAGLLRSPGILIDGNRQAGCKTGEGGQFLQFMSQGALTPGGLVRQLPPKTGDLTPAPEHGDILDTMTKLAADFLAALQAGDRAKLTRLLQSGYAADRLLSDASAISDLRKPGPHPFRIFVQKGGKLEAFGAAACSCRTADCSKSWPIALRDADNQITRPYACLIVHGRAESSGREGLTVFDLDASIGADGLPEPARK